MRTDIRFRRVYNLHFVIDACFSEGSVPPAWSDGSWTTMLLELRKHGRTTAEWLVLDRLPHIYLGRSIRRRRLFPSKIETTNAHYRLDVPL